MLCRKIQDPNFDAHFSNNFYAITVVHKLANLLYQYTQQKSSTVNNHACTRYMTFLLTITGFIAMYATLASRDVVFILYFVL